MSKRSSYIDSLSTREKVLLLEQLLQDPVIKEKAEAIVEEMLRRVEDDETVEAELAEAVRFGLDLLDVQADVWDMVGLRSDDYVEPHEFAWEVFNDALQPFIDELERWQELNRPKQATIYCRGLLTGIQQFLNGDNEILDWIVDAPEEAMAAIVKKFSAWAAEENARQVQEHYAQLLKNKKIR